MTGKNFKDLALELMSGNYMNTFVEYGIVNGEEQLSITQFYDDGYVKQSFLIDKQRKHVMYAKYNSKLIGINRDEFDIDEFTYFTTNHSCYSREKDDDHDMFLYMGDNNHEYCLKFYVEQSEKNMKKFIEELCKWC